jgi:hypothetical protein
MFRTVMADPDAHRSQSSFTAEGQAAAPTTLQTSDCSVAGPEELFAVERKSVADLVACYVAERERFERELHRLRGCRFEAPLWPIVPTERRAR